MNKSTILLMLSISLPALLAGNKVVTPGTQKTHEKISATHPTLDDQVILMQKQIADLQKQLDDFVKQENHSCAVAEPKQASYTQFDKGFMPVPGTTGAVKISGMVKLDMIYDGKSNTGEVTQVQRVPYDLTVNQGSDYSWKKHCYMNAKQTKLQVDYVAKNSSGQDAKAFIAMDFFGAPVLGDSAVNGGSGFSSTYLPRLCYAGISYAGLEAGNLFTTFHLTEAALPTVDFIGITGGYATHPLIRYTHKLDNLSLTAAAERSQADYVQFTNTNNTVRYTYFTTYSTGISSFSTGNLSKSEHPDLAMKVKYSFNNGSTIGFSGVYRDLQIKNNSGSDNRNYRATGHGVNFAVKIMTFGKSFFTGAIMTGKGIGRYIFEANGRSAFLDQTRGYKAIPMTMFWAGYCQVWNLQWRTSVGVARIELGTTSFNRDALKTTAYAVNDPGIDRTFNKFLINTMHKPEENLEFGLEYFYLPRKSVNTNRGTGVNASNGVDSNTGTGHRFQFATSYKF